MQRAAVVSMRGTVLSPKVRTIAFFTATNDTIAAVAWDVSCHLEIKDPACSTAVAVNDHIVRDRFVGVVGDVDRLGCSVAGSRDAVIGAEIRALG